MDLKGQKKKKKNSSKMQIKSTKNDMNKNKTKQNKKCKTHFSSTDRLSRVSVFLSLCITLCIFLSPSVCYSFKEKNIFFLSVCRSLCLSNCFSLSIFQTLSAFSFLSNNSVQRYLLFPLFLFLSSLRCIHLSI